MNTVTVESAELHLIPGTVEYSQPILIQKQTEGVCRVFLFSGIPSLGVSDAEYTVKLADDAVGSIEVCLASASADVLAILEPSQTVAIKIVSDCNDTWCATRDHLSIRLVQGETDEEKVLRIKTELRLVVTDMVLACEKALAKIDALLTQV